MRLYTLESILIAYSAEVAQISLQVCSAFYKAVDALKLTKTIQVPTSNAPGPTQYRPEGSGSLPVKTLPYIGGILAGAAGLAGGFALGL